jgi:hypothetical protein
MSAPTNTSQWYRVTLPAAECGTKAAILQNDFETLYKLNGAPNGAALFTSREEESKTSHFYFSPGAVAIARGLIQHFSGEACSPPMADADIPKLLVGRNDERDILLSSGAPKKRGAKGKLDRFLGRE